MNSRKIVCWIGDAPNHKALVSKISKEFNIAGIVIDQRTKNKSFPFSKTARRIINKTRYDNVSRTWQSLQGYYASSFMLPDKTETFMADSINSEAVLGFTKKAEPDIVLVSGTSLIKGALLSLQLPIGTINLHTGLSPYVKGGPNCTNWCIANNNWSLVGNTVMWLSDRIDSGNIITSERTNINNIKSLYGIHYCVMEHAHDLMLRAIRYILKSDPPYQSVPQKSIAKGTLYLNKMWTPKMKKRLIENLKITRDQNQFNNIVTVPIPS